MPRSGRYGRDRWDRRNVGGALRPDINYHPHGVSALFPKLKAGGDLALPRIAG
jgi:hypothetical protein